MTQPKPKRSLSEMYLEACEFEPWKTCPTILININDVNFGGHMLTEHRRPIDECVAKLIDAAERTYGSAFHEMVHIPVCGALQVLRECLKKGATKCTEQ